MIVKLKKTKKKQLHTKHHISSKSKILDYEWNDKMPLETLIAIWNKIYQNGIKQPKQHDPEIEHSLENDILIKFILEIENGLLSSKDISRIARLIKTVILDKHRKKWYSD